MQNAALPPAGPPKNMEPKRNNLHAVTAATGGGVPGAGPAVTTAHKGGIVTGTVGAATLPTQQAVVPASPGVSKCLKALLHFAILELRWVRKRKTVCVGYT